MVEDWISKIQKTEVCDLFGNLKISTKSITLFAGENTIGKTATCLHLSKFAINNKFVVLYFDTEQKLIDRPEPNLLNVFLQENFELFKKNFYIEHSLFKQIIKDKDGIETDEVDKVHFENKISEINPSLVIIDSIYTSFTNFFTESRRRAKAIGNFMRYLRNLMIEKDLAIIITTKIGRIVKEEQEQNVILGGQELLYNCDTKAKMKMIDNQLQEKKIVFSVDNQEEFVLILDFGGIIKKI